MPHPTPRATAVSERQRILVISGDPRIRERLYDTLSRHGFLASTAVSLENGLEILQHGKSVRLILLDRTVNRGRCAPFIDRVRHSDERLPILLLTRAEHAPAEMSAIRHIQACLPSDVDEEALLAALRRWLPPPRSFKPIAYPGPILIVDDERELLQQLEGFLRVRGCTVLTAASGEEALAALAHAQPALVLLDIKMPGLDGLVTLKKIKALRPDLPVIMMTALEDQSLMAQASALGAYEHILKPFNLTVLGELLAHLKKRAGTSPAREILSGR